MMFDTTDYKYTVPASTLESLIEFGKQGRRTGDFLRAVLSNDLFDAFGRADLHNTAAMGEIVKFIYNEMPSTCHGSRKAYDEWIEHDGLGKQAVAVGEEAP